MLRTSLVFALCGSCFAQAWSIPSRGVIEFDREVERLELITDGKASASKAEKLFGRILPPGLLFAGELDAAKRRIEQPPWDLRGLARQLAFDMSTAGFRGKKRFAFSRMLRFGDVQVSASFAPGDGGAQRIECKLTSAPPARLPGENSRYVDMHVAKHTGERLHGTLRIERETDTERGLVSRFRAELEAAIPGGRLVFAERWTLRRVRENRDREFDEAVRTAIDRGAEWVHAELGRRGKHLRGGEVDHHAKSANSGRLALGLLTLVKAGVPRDDPVVIEGFADLRERDIVDSYSLGIALLALEALYTPVTEREDLVRGIITAPYPRQPSDEDRAAIERFTAQLMRNLDARVDPGHVARFNYTPGKRYDNSITQYALLGLYAAQLCGIPQTPRFWRAAAQHWVDDQTRPRGRVELTLVSNREFESSRQFDAAKRAVSSVRVDARSWGYQAATGGRPTFDHGSMAVAGLTGLAICASALRGLELEPPADLDDATRSGFAWLAKHMRFDTNPNQYRTDQRWLYYYLYGLERACELNGVALIQDRDWYFEGATTLLALQAKNGTWVAAGAASGSHGHAIERTCFAVLFLRKESLPVFTAR